MNKLLDLLKDGHARTTVMLALELHTTPADIRRKLEYMENMGIIRRVSLTTASCGEGSCSGCAGCGPNAGAGINTAGGPNTVCGSNDKRGKSGCAGCIPGAELMNMGEMWEVVR